MKSLSPSKCSTLQLVLGDRYLEKESISTELSGIFQNTPLLQQAILGDQKCDITNGILHLFWTKINRRLVVWFNRRASVFLDQCADQI